MINSVNEPLNDDEMNELDRFLLERLDDADTREDMDEGLLGLSELDGFFTAIASGPELILPSEWLPAVWGEQAPEWPTSEDFMKIFQLMTRHYNGVVNSLMASDYPFEPIFNEREVDGRLYTVVDEWCDGYMRGVSLCAEAWDAGGDEVFEMLQPILLFSSEAGWEVLEQMDDQAVMEVQAAIPRTVREVHGFWLARRGSGDSKQPEEGLLEPLRAPDDPCPCGSGKPFRKCCLH